MKTFIKCPKCRHKAFTRFAVIVKALTVASIGVDYSLRRPSFIPTKERGDKYTCYWPNLVDLLKHGDVLSFLCYHCGRPYSRKMQPEVLDYLQKKIIFLKLTGKYHE